MQAPIEIIDFIEAILSIFFYDIKQRERAAIILIDNLVEVSCKAKLREGKKTLSGLKELDDVLKAAGIRGELKKRLLRRRKERNIMQHDLVAVTVSHEHCADSLIDFCELLRKLWGKSALDSAPEWIICSLRIAKLYSRSGDQDKRANLENYLEKYNWNLVLENEKITFQPALEKMELEFKSFTGIPIGRVKPNANEIVILIGSTKHWTLLLKKFHKEVTICLDDMGIDVI
jgi:hypothetical protein